MSIGKSSISRLSRAAEPKESGIRSLAPEVPAGDPATPAPFAVVTDELTAAPTEAPKAPATEKKKPGRKPKSATAPAEAPAAAPKKKPGPKPKSKAATETAKTTAAKAPAKKATAAKTAAAKSASTPKKAPVTKKTAVKEQGAFVPVPVGEALPYWLL